MKYSRVKLLELKEVAQRRKELLENILSLTSRRKFKGEESEIQEFSDFLDLREPFIDEMLEYINTNCGELKEFEVDFSSNDKTYREVSQLIQSGDDARDKCLELDRINNENMQKVYNKLQMEVVKLNKAKKARNSYNFFQAQSEIKNNNRTPR